MRQSRPETTKPADLAIGGLLSGARGHAIWHAASLTLVRCDECSEVLRSALSEPDSRKATQGERGTPLFLDRLGNGQTISLKDP